MNLDPNIFWGSALQKTFLFLCRNPQSEYYDRQVSQHSGVSKSAANYALRQMADWGWIIMRRQGRMKFYRADMEHPAVRQAKIMDAVIYLNPLLVKLKPVAQKIVLYGSAALGQNTIESDIDLLVICQQPEQVQKIASRFPEKIKIMAVKPVDWTAMAKKQSVFYDEVQQKGIALWRK